MATQGSTNFQIPPEMRALAEKSVEQAKEAFDGFMSATQTAVATLEGQATAAQTGAKDVTKKAVSFAERNVAATFEFAQKLTQAKDAQELMRLHAEYVKAQMEALGNQARELGQSAAQMGQGRTAR